MSNDPYDALLHAILWITAEEVGEIPLWEVMGEIRGELSGELQRNGLDPSPALARRIVESLASNGWIEFFRRYDGRDDESLTWSEAQADVASEWWTERELPSGNLYIRPTQAGRKASAAWKVSRLKQGQWWPMPPL